MEQQQLTLSFGPTLIFLTVEASAFRVLLKLMIPMLPDESTTKTRSIEDLWQLNTVVVVGAVVVVIVDGRVVVEVDVGARVVVGLVVVVIWEVVVVDSVFVVGTKIVVEVVGICVVLVVFGPRVVFSSEEPLSQPCPWCLWCLCRRRPCSLEDEDEESDGDPTNFYISLKP